MLKETALAALHRKLAGRLVDFGGWNMPLHYGSQIEEHHAVRDSAGVFDVSHMTIVDILGMDAESYLCFLLANDVSKLKQVGAALYTGMLTKDGGVIDDLIVYRLENGFRLVVNCATRDKDIQWMAMQARSYAVDIKERSDLSMLAIQGPNARSAVHSIIGKERIEDLPVFNGASLDDLGYEDWYVGRTGYTGEDGYELMLPDANAEYFFEQLLEKGVKPCGLAARDTLRLEAGMNLYGNEMNEQVSPLSANMGWTIDWNREDRDFIGRSALVEEKESGVKHKLVGLVMKGKGILRRDQLVSMDDCDAQGVVTSGTFSPTLGISIALARVPREFSQKAKVQIRNRQVDVDIVKPGFVRHGQNVF